MIPFVAGVLSGMALQKVLGGNSSSENPPEFEPVQMREVSEEHVKEILAKASKTIQGGENSLERIPAQEVSQDKLPKYIRDKLAAQENSAVAD